MGWLALVLSLPTSAASAAEPQAPPVDDGPSGRTIAGYVTLAIGGLSVAGGGAAAIFALHKRIQLEPLCQPRDDCPLATAGDIEQMQLAAHIATGLSLGGFAVAGVGAGLLLWPESERPAKARLELRPAGLGLSVPF